MSFKVCISPNFHWGSSVMDLIVNELKPARWFLMKMTCGFSFCVICPSLFPWSLRLLQLMHKTGEFPSSAHTPPMYNISLYRERRCICYYFTFSIEALLYSMRPQWEWEEFLTAAATHDFKSSFFFNWVTEWPEKMGLYVPSYFLYSAATFCPSNSSPPWWVLRCSFGSWASPGPWNRMVKHHMIQSTFKRLAGFPWWNRDIYKFSGKAMPSRAPCAINII